MTQNLRRVARHQLQMTNLDARTLSVSSLRSTPDVLWPPVREVVTKDAGRRQNCGSSLGAEAARSASR